MNEKYYERMKKNNQLIIKNINYRDFKLITHENPNLVVKEEDIENFILEHNNSREKYIKMAIQNYVRSLSSDDSELNNILQKFPEYEKFIVDDKKTDEYLISCSWYLWMLNLIEFKVNKKPNQSKIKNLIENIDLKRNYELKTIDDILEMADLICRYYWLYNTNNYDEEAKNIINIQEFVVSSVLKWNDESLQENIKKNNGTYEKKDSKKLQIIDKEYIQEEFNKLHQKYDNLFKNNNIDKQDIYDFEILGNYSKNQIKLTVALPDEEKEKLIQEKYTLIKKNLDIIFKELLDFILFDIIDFGMQFWLDKFGDIAPFIDKEKLPANLEELKSFVIDRNEYEKLGTLKYYEKYLPYINLEKLKIDSKGEYLEIDNETSDGWISFQFSSDKGIFFNSIVVDIDDNGNFANIQS